MLLGLICHCHRDIARIANTIIPLANQLTKRLAMLQQGLAFNLASRGPLNGKPLIVYNRTASRVDELRSSLIPSDQAKVSPASSAEAAAKDADIIFTSFADDQSVVDMYDRLLAGCNGKVEGKLFAETSTVLPETAEKLAGKVQEAGGTYVAMPSKF